GLPSNRKPEQSVPPPNFPLQAGTAFSPTPALDVPAKNEASATARHLTLDELRDPGERTAFRILVALSVPIWLLIAFWIVLGFGTPLLAIGVFWVFSKIGQLFAAAYI